MYISCAYSAISKNPKQLQNCLKVAKTSAFFNDFMVSSAKSTLILLPFLTVAQHESGTRINCILVSDSIYNKQLSSQCNLTSQIEPVQDKYFICRDAVCLNNPC